MAGFINAFGITVFLNPVHLYDSGISGTSMLLSQITPSVFSLSFFLSSDGFHNYFRETGYLCVRYIFSFSHTLSLSCATNGTKAHTSISSRVR